MKNFLLPPAKSIFPIGTWFHILEEKRRRSGNNKRGEDALLSNLARPGTLFRTGTAANGAECQGIGRKKKDQIKFQIRFELRLRN